MADKQSRETAQQTFRQFAWNLAGTLADKGRPVAKPQGRAGEQTLMAGPIPVDADGRFAGYASVFNKRDSGGDIVLPGAFAKSLKQRAGRIRLLFQHDPKEPVGFWEELREDSHGLFARGRLVPGVPRADALKRLIEAEALDGLSIGFRTVKASRQAGNRLLHEIDLYEISIVTFPMMEAARIAAPVSAGAAIAAATRTIRNR